MGGRSGAAELVARISTDGRILAPRCGWAVGSNEYERAGAPGEQVLEE